MSTENLNKISKVANLENGKCNINVLMKRMSVQEKKEKLQNRIVLLTLFFSLGVIGYFFI